MDNKPSWDDAPEWANWLAMDENGEWWWFEYKPHKTAHFWNSLGRVKPVVNLEWQETLEERPQ